MTSYHDFLAADAALKAAVTHAEGTLAEKDKPKSFFKRHRKTDFTELQSAAFCRPFCTLIESVIIAAADYYKFDKYEKETLYDPKERLTSVLHEMLLRCQAHDKDICKYVVSMYD